MNRNQGWNQIVQAGKDAAHQMTVRQLEQQLALERNAHKETLRALESSRLTHGRRYVMPKPPKKQARTGDFVEVIFSDVHGNRHDRPALAALLADLKAIQPDRVFIGGDFINCGGFLAEHHTLGYVAEMDDSYEDDIRVANMLLDAIQQAAPRAEIHYLEGNHEWRVERWALTQKLAHHKDVEFLRRTFAPEYTLRLEHRGIRYYRQGHTHGECTVPGWVKMDKLFYVHKLNNARNAADVAVSQAGGNVVFFDTHRADFKPVRKPGVGLISAWNPGCLCELQPLWNHTRPSEWTHGYLVRSISRKTGNFQMVNVAINEGVSYGGMMLAGGTAQAEA